MNKTQKQLLHLVGDALFNHNADLPISEEIIKEAKFHAVEGLINPEAYQVFANSVRIIKAHAELCALLDEIPVVIIKGYASSFYYPQPNKRTMGDVDFFVNQKDFRKTEDILLQAGYKFDYETELHRCFQKAGIAYEMHSFFNGVPRGSADINKMLEDTIVTSRCTFWGRDMIRIPDDFHNGIICLLHFNSHLMQSQVGLRHFCDWACIVKGVNNFENVFKEKFERVGLWTCARILSLTAVKFLGLPYQSWMGEADEVTLDLLMEEIMASGNMGRKRNDYESEWFVDREGNGSGIRGIITSLNQVTKKNWPAAGRCPLVYPIGWAFFSLRYLIRSLFGKRRKIKFIEVASQAERKNRLLKSLQLFQT